MLSFKTALLATAILAGGASVAATCLNANELHVLLTDKDIWHAQVEGLPSGNYLGTAATWDSHGVGTYDNFSNKVINAFSDTKCFNEVFVNNKANWEHMYPAVRKHVIAGVYRMNKLGALKFNILTDVACKEVVNLAGSWTSAHPGIFPSDPGSAAPANFQLTANQFKQFRAGCWSDNANAYRFWSTAMIKNIPAAAFDDSFAKDIVKQYVSDGIIVFQHLNAGQVEKFVSDPERCKAIDSTDVAFSNMHQDVVKKYNAACLKSMSWLSDSVAGSDKAKDWFKRLNSKAFSTLDYALHDTVVELITPVQAAEIDADDASEYWCSHFSNLPSLTPAALAKVDKRCMAGFLTTAPDPVKLGPKIAKAPGDIFSAIPLGDVPSIKKVLNADNTKFFTADHFASLLAVPAACEHLVPPANDAKLEWSRLPTITAACWAAPLPDATKARIIANDGAIKRLEETILEHAEKDDFPLDALMAFAKKRPALIKHIGASVPAGPNHPCAVFSLDDFKDRKEVGALVGASNSPCVRSLTGLEAVEEETGDKDFFKKLPALIFASLDLDVLKEHKHLPKDFWSQMQPPVFDILATPANCAELDTALLGQINAEAMSVLHPDCLAALKGDLTEGQTGKAPKSLFEHVDAATWPKLKHIGSITPEQLAHLSTKVADKKRHAGTLFTDTTVGALSVGQVGALNAGTVEAWPERAWKGLNGERFKALRPEVLVKVTCDKLKQVPLDSLIELTAAQAARLGEGVGKAEESPRCVFTKDVLGRMKDGEAARIMSGAPQLAVSLLLVVTSMVLGLWLA